MAKLSEEQQFELENYIRHFTEEKTIIDAMAFDSRTALDKVVKETYGYNLKKLIRVYQAKGLAEFRDDMFILSKDKPSAMVLLYKDLESQGLIGKADEDIDVEEINIKIVTGEK